MSEISDESENMVTEEGEEKGSGEVSTSVQIVLAALMISSIFMALFLGCYILKQRNKQFVTSV